MTQETTRILEHFGYVFEQRGVIAVKGKGDLMTYYIIGKKPDGAPPDIGPTTAVTNTSNAPSSNASPQHTLSAMGGTAHNFPTGIPQLPPPSPFLKNPTQSPSSFPAFSTNCNVVANGQDTTPTRQPH